MNQTILANQIAQQIWSETGKMYRVSVTKNGDIQIPLHKSDPEKLITKAVSELKNIKVGCRISHKDCIQLNFKFKENQK